MPIRLSGMSSGLDTESLVSALVMSYRTKKDDLVKAQTKLSWKQEKWKSVNTSIYSFYSGKLSNLRLTTGYNLKKATINNSSYATVKASTSAVTGTQTLKVKKLASTGYLTGGKISAADSSTKLSGSSKLSEVNGLSSVSGSFSVTTKDKSSTIELSGDMTINQLIVKLKDAGLNASFDETNQRFFVSSKASGADNDFSLTAGDTNGAKALKALGLQATTKETLTADMKKYQDVVAMGESAYVASTAESRYQSTVEGYNSSIKTLKETNASLEEENKKLAYEQQYFNEFITKLEYQNNGDGTWSPKDTATEAAARKYLSDKADELKAKQTAGTITDDEKLELEAVNEVLKVAGNATMLLKRTEKTDGNGVVTYESDIDAALNKVTESISKNTAQIATNKDTITGYYTKVGANASDSTQVDAGGNIILSYADSKAVNSALVTEYESAATAEFNYATEMTEAYDRYQNNTATDADLEKLGISTATDSTSPVRIAGSDAQIELNGAVFENTTNNFSINGLTIQATALTGDDPVTITTETDVDAIYDSIKDLFSEYNELIKSLDTAYNAASSKGYEPLTDEEKDEMSDDEIEKWETKIKDSLLRRDSTLDGIITALKNDMLSTYTVNGKSYSLSSFGISTGGYFSSGSNEKGVYHIDGDEDDSLTSGNADKLRAAIANDSEAVVSFFSQLSTKLYDTLSKKMASTTMSSAFTVYNDKEMATQYSEYKTKISAQEEKIATWEDYYYKKFSRMESALALLNSQTSSISGLFG